MGVSTAFVTVLHGLLFNATAIADVAEDDTSSPITDIYVSLHTESPGDAGNQATAEIGYTGYARVAVPRDASGWTPSGRSVVPVASIEFPVGTVGVEGEIASYWGIGKASSGAGMLWFYGPIVPAILCGEGIPPVLTVASMVTADAG